MNDEFRDQQMTKDREYNIAIVGSGITSSYVLIHLVAHLEDKRSGNAMRVAVIEKAGEFWTGVPYGSRSGRDSLLISSLREFLPQDQERGRFVDWLSKNRDEICRDISDNPGSLTAGWLRANKVAMENGAWDELFIPRFLFGLYITQRVEQVLKDAADRGILTVDLVKGDTLDIRQNDGVHTLDIATDSEGTLTIRANKVVLAIGSPQDSALKSFRPAESDQSGCVIDDLYVPSLTSNLERIASFLKTPEGRANNEVLIAGSNASALEALYVLNNSSAVAAGIGKYHILSPSGEFPHRINPEPRHAGHPPKRLRDLVARKAHSAQEILEAVELDVADAKAAGASIADMHGAFSAGILTALDQLEPSEQSEFVTHVGVEIGRFQRRAGAEYLDVVDHLVASGKLEFIKGRLCGLDVTEDSGLRFTYATDGDKAPRQESAPIGVVIGCVGIADLSRSSAPLIQNLLRRKLCEPNASKRGILVNENYEASENFYVMGPLIAGNYVGSVRVWHAESCHRIISIAQGFSKVLVDA